MLSRNKTIAMSGLMIACGILFGYIEFLFPLPIGIPGVKLGLSNVITLVCMVCLSPQISCVVLILRVILSGILFGNFFGLLYSLSGAALSFIAMYLIYRLDKFSIVGVSVVGGVAHNVAQLMVACFVVSELKMIYYLPVLLVSGLLCGIVVGTLGNILIPRIAYILQRGD